MRRGVSVEGTGWGGGGGGGGRGGGMVRGGEEDWVDGCVGR